MDSKYGFAKLDLEILNFKIVSKAYHIYEVWLLNNETAYEKEFYFKNYSTI